MLQLAAVSPNSCVLSWSSPPLLRTEPTPYTVRACTYTPRSCPLSFEDMKVRREQVSLVGWHNRNSSSQEPSSLLLFAHSLTIVHPFHTLCMLQYSRCGLTSALKSHTRVSLSRVSNDLRRRPRTLFTLLTCASVCLTNFNFSSMMTPRSFSSVAAYKIRSPIL